MYDFDYRPSGGSTTLTPTQKVDYDEVEVFDGIPSGTDFGAETILKDKNTGDLYTRLEDGSVHKVGGDTTIKPVATLAEMNKISTLFELTADDGINKKGLYFVTAHGIKSKIDSNVLVKEIVYTATKDSQIIDISTDYPNASLNLLADSNQSLIETYAGSNPVKVTVNSNVQLTVDNTDLIVKTGDKFKIMIKE